MYTGETISIEKQNDRQGNVKCYMMTVSSLGSQEATKAVLTTGAAMWGLDNLQQNHLGCSKKW